MASRRNRGHAERSIPSKVKPHCCVSALHAVGILQALSSDLLLNISSSTQATNSSQNAILTASNLSERNMLAAIEDTSNKLRGDITSLMQQMSSLRIDESIYETLFANFQASHADVLSRLVSGIETILLEQEANRNTNNESRAAIAQERICTCLSFRDVDSRRNQIREAHEDTYRWILGPQSTIEVCPSKFPAWLDSPASEHRLFWISGKPGSGKSTLMQYIGQNLKKSDCARWLSGRDLFVCRLFLWNPGRELQKSFQGLLRALLYQLFLAHPWLIKAVVSEEKWSIACAVDSELDWSVQELRIAIECCLDRISISRKIFLLIDGLDELEGTDEDRYDMLNFLRKLAIFESVKLCVSSRPWNIFSDYFHGLPQLQLQDFTKTDIDKYVRHSLSCSMHLQNSYLHNSGEGEKLIQEIVDKASGVFLWVRLVVQELLRGFRDGETIRTLRRKIDSMPADLDGFFSRILDSIDPPYRSEGSAFLQTALFSLQNEDADWPRGLLEFTFLEAEDPNFALRPDYDFTEINLLDLDALEYRVDLGKRRVNSRCMGLLEWVNSSATEKFTTVPDSNERLKQLLSTDVNFLHRSLMDFLLTADAQNILQSGTGGPFHARRFLHSAMLAKALAINAKCRDERNSEASQDDFLLRLLHDETDRLLRATASSEDLDLVLLNVIMARLEPAFELLRKSNLPRNTMAPRYISLLSEQYAAKTSSVMVAITYALTTFVKAHLTRDATDDEKQCFLHLALNPLTPAGSSPKIVSHILTVGANPNKSLDCRFNKSSIWWCPRRLHGIRVSSIQVQIVELMVKHGADTVLNEFQRFNYAWCITSDILVSLTDVLELFNFTDEDHCRLKSILDNKDKSKTLNHGDAVIEDPKPNKRKRVEDKGFDASKRPKASDISELDIRAQTELTYNLTTVFVPFPVRFLA